MTNALRGNGLLTKKGDGKRKQNAKRAEKARKVCVSLTLSRPLLVAFGYRPPHTCRRKILALKGWISWKMQTLAVCYEDGHQNLIGFKRTSECEQTSSKKGESKQLFKDSAHIFHLVTSYFDQKLILQYFTLSYVFLLVLENDWCLLWFSQLERSHGIKVIKQKLLQHFISSFMNNCRFSTNKKNCWSVGIGELFRFPMLFSVMWPCVICPTKC